MLVNFIYLATLKLRFVRLSYTLQYKADIFDAVHDTDIFNLNMNKIVNYFFKIKLPRKLYNYSMVSRIYMNTGAALSNV